MSEFKPRPESQLSLLDVAEPATPMSQLSAIAYAFEPARLTQARRLSGLPKKAVAEALGVSPVAVTHWEAGTTKPRPNHIAALAETLDVKAQFFSGGRPYARLDGTSAHFRSLRKTPASHRDKALAFTEQVWELTYALERRVALPPVDLPGYAGGDYIGWDFDSPSDAAQKVRRLWDLGTDPIAHLVRKIEMHGVVVTLTPFAGTSTATVDAFSTAHLPRPIIVLTPDRADDVYRHRFTAAHELGHLLIHGNLPSGDPQHEKEADQFAAELLTPREHITPQLPTRLDLNALDRLGDEWGVSVDSLIYRCRETGVITEATYRRAYQRLNQLRSLGLFSAATVDGFPGEIPALLTGAFAVAASMGCTLNELADELTYTLPRLRLLLGDPDTRPELRLVSPE